MTSRREDGFTLIELMIVVLIIAILIAIAIPTFFGAQDRAGIRRTQTDLRNVLTTARVIATNHEGRFVPDAGDADFAVTLGRLEPALAYTMIPAEVIDHRIGVWVDTVNNEVHLWAKSEPGEWFGVHATHQGRTFYCRGTEAAVRETSPCTRTNW
ncbi:MAG TPA: prepilin-type N-terminal cleavage/methylation domain-containing protein [Acidimicrobiales bacterium]|nr:prepilin-type N-terminal cleavage/methylation domain-containing protein [Acidimicrobiales bacterium]